MSKLFRLSRRMSLILVETLAIVAVLIGIAAVFAVWRLGTGPLDLEFAKDYIQEALRDEERGAYVELGSAQAEWPDLAGPLLLQIKGAKIFSEAGQEIISVDHVAVSLSKTYLLIGRISPVAITIENPKLHVIRTKEGGLDIGFRKSQTLIQHASEIEKQTAFTEQLIEYIARPRKGGISKSPLAALQTFEIKDASVEFNDKKLGHSWLLPHMDIAFGRAREGVQAALHATVDHQGVQGAFDALAVISWRTKNVQLEAALDNFPLGFLGEKATGIKDFDDNKVSFSGSIEAVLAPDLLPLAAQMSLTSPGGEMMVPKFSTQKPLTFENLVIGAQYDAEKNKFDVTSAHVKLANIDVQAEASFSVLEQQLAGPIRVAIEKMAHKDLVAAWPEALAQDNSKEWIADKPSGGTLTDLYADIDFIADKAPEGWSADVKDVTAGFAFEDMDMDYRPPMMPVKNGKGKGVFSYSGDRLDVEIESAQIADLRVNGATLEFVDIIKEGAGQAAIEVDLEGPLKTGIEYLSREPIALAHKFDMAQIKGSARAKVNVAFPTNDIDIEDVTIGVTGSVNDIFLPNVVNGLPLAGGPFEIAVKDNEFFAKGRGQVDSRAADIDYREFLHSAGKPYSSKVKAALSADENLRLKFGIDLSEFMTGPAVISLDYTKYTDGRAEADVTADLENAHLFFKPLGIDKQPGAKAEAHLKALLKDDVLLEIKDLEAKGPELLLERSDLTFTKKDGNTAVKTAKISRFAAGESVGGVDFRVEESGAYNIKLIGPFLDLRPVLNDKEKKDPAAENPPMVLDIQVERARAADDAVIQHALFYIDMNAQGAFNRFEVEAIAGKGNMSLSFAPGEAGLRRFKFRADDAGATLKAFGIYNNIQGGTLAIDGVQAKGESGRDITGKAEMRDFKVVQAPTLARLLNALSLPGLLGLLTNEGLSFSKLEADFLWQYRQGGSILQVEDGRTSGSSVGFTFDGTFDRAADVLNVEGTIVPLSEINKVIGSIPLIGDIITGGTGSLIAATYSIKGPSKEPQVFVNPLSVLTPGILRRILFEN